MRCVRLLEKALAIYGKGQGGGIPVRDKKMLGKELRQAIADATGFCTSHGVQLAMIENTLAANLQRAGLSPPRRIT